MANRAKEQDITDEGEQLKILTSGLPPSWAARLVDSRGKNPKRLHYVRHVDRSTSWVPPPENWRCPNLLPYGWELGIDDDGHIYYINHLQEVTTRRDPRLEASLYEDTRKEFLLEKSDDADGFGFSLSDLPPYTVTSVQSSSAAAPYLNDGDTISRIGNIEIFELSKEEVSELLLKAASSGTVKIQVFGRDSVQNGSQMETNAEGKMATHLLPGVLRVDLMTGGARKFRITKTTTVQDIVDNVCKRSDISAPEMFGLYIETVTAEATTLKILYGWQLLANLPSDIIASMVPEAESNESERHEADMLPIKRIVCRLRFLPGSVDELLDIDPRAFDYFFHQTVHDIANDLFSQECPNDVAMVLGSLSIAEFCLQQGKKKVSLKEVEKTVGGLQPFFPSSILSRLKPGDLRKHAKKALEAQSLDLELEDIRDIQLKYLNLVSEFPSLGGARFRCIDEDSREKMLLLVSPLNGFSSIESLLEAGWCSEIRITPFCLFDGLESIKVDDVEGEGDDVLSRVTIHFEESTSEPRRFILKRVAAREMVHLLQGYATLLAKVELPLDDPVLLLETKQEIDKTPPYCSLHHVVATPWSYLDLAWDVYVQMMNLSPQAASPSIAETDTSAPFMNSVAFPVGKLLVDKSSLPQYMAVDLSAKLLYGRRRKKRIVFLRKTGADLARDFLNKPEPPADEDEENFTAHLSSRQMANTTSVAAEDDADGGEDDQAPNQPTKQSSAAAAALAALLSRSAPVVDESEGSATAQPLRGLVSSEFSGNNNGNNAMNFSDSADAAGGSGGGDAGWGGGPSADVQLEGTPGKPAGEAASAAGWGDEDTGPGDQQQPSLSDFGVSVRGSPHSFGFGDAGPGEEDEIAGW